MLTERQRGILEFIQTEQREKSLTPSTREIQKHFGFASQTSVMQYIATLERKGFLNRHARKARALITPVQKVRITDIPIYGQIPAGMATLTEQTIEGHVSLDTRSANSSKNGKTFALRVRGDSMIDAHIADGDFVLIRPQNTARNGDIVVAQVEENAVTLKRFFKEKDQIRLQPANEAYPPQFYDDVRIQGKLIGVIRRLD